MTSIGIEDVFYEPVSFVSWKPAHGFQELRMPGPTDSLHLHRVVAVWVMDGGRCIGDIAGEPVRNEHNGLREITRETVSNSPQRLHICHGLRVALAVSKRHPCGPLLVVLGDEIQ